MLIIFSILLLVAYTICLVIFLRKKYMQENIAEKNRLEQYASQAEARVSLAKTRCEDWDRRVEVLQKQSENIQKEIVVLKANRDDEKQKLANQRAEIKAQRTCPRCGTEGVDYCPHCGFRLNDKSVEIKHLDIKWDVINEFLHSIAFWDEPKNFIKGGTCSSIVLPWPKKDSVTFSVTDPDIGDVDYEYGKTNDDEDGKGWWAYLQWEHPIIGRIKLVNKVNKNNDHFAEYGDDEYVVKMDEGIIDSGSPNQAKIRNDVRQAVKRGLTDLALYLRNERSVTFNVSE